MICFVFNSLFIIGNYILSEVLYFSKLYPWIKCEDVPDDYIELLYNTIKKVCKYSFLSQTPQLCNKATQIDTNIGNDEYPYIKVPYPFDFSVYSRSQCPQGYTILKELGSHKRSIYWVPEIQTIGKGQ